MQQLPSEGTSISNAPSNLTMLPQGPTAPNSISAQYSLQVKSGNLPSLAQWSQSGVRGGEEQVAKGGAVRSNYGNEAEKAGGFDLSSDEEKWDNGRPQESRTNFPLPRAETSPNSNRRRAGKGSQMAYDALGASMD